MKRYRWQNNRVLQHSKLISIFLNYFSNGNLDPWSSGGVTESSSSSIVPLLIEFGAHHLDLRAANPLDPQSVLTARQTEKNLLKMWLGQVQGDNKGQVKVNKLKLKGQGHI